MKLDTILEERVPVKEVIEEVGAERTFELAREAARGYVEELRSNGKISFSDPKEGEVPTIHVVRDTVPEAWEDTTMALLGIGSKVHTGYDPTEGRDEYGDYRSFQSLEGTTTMHIGRPDGEPRFHKLFLGGFLRFGSYRAEIEGAHDHWMISPERVVKMLKEGRFGEIETDSKWKYAYSQRVRNYPFIDIEGKPQTINQLDSVIRKLSSEPLSKSGQVTTWDPRWDHNDGQMKDINGEPAIWKRRDQETGEVEEEYHSPCLQRIWFRLLPKLDDENNLQAYVANINVHFRSRDHLKAVPHNIYGIAEGMVRPTMSDLSEELGVPVVFGRWADINDSLHLYGHFLDPRQQGGDAESYLADVFKVARGEPIEDRLITGDTEKGRRMLDYAQKTIEEEYRETMENPDKGMESIID